MGRQPGAQPLSTFMTMQQQRPCFAGLCFQTMLLFLALANDVAAVTQGVASQQPLIPPAPAPGVPGSPAAPTLNSCRLKFVIDNYNYEDLAQKVCEDSKDDVPSLKTTTGQVEEAVKKWKKERPPGSTPEEDSAGLATSLSKAVESVTDAVTTSVTETALDASDNLEDANDEVLDTVEDTAAETLDNDEDLDDSSSLLAIHHANPPAPADLAPTVNHPLPAKPSPRMTTGGSMVECFGTVEDMLRKVVKDAIATVLYSNGMTVSPLAAMLAKQTSSKMPTSPVNALLRGSKSRQQNTQMPSYTIAYGTSPVGMAPAMAMPVAPAPAPPKPEFDIFVKFRPGPEKRVDGKVVGRSVLVGVTITGEPKNGVHDILLAQPHKVLTTAQGTGVLNEILKKKMAEATGVPPRLIKFVIKPKQIEQWSIDKCRVHFTKIVKEFSAAYTRRMVPQAIYNECSNFMTRITFSDDMVIDDLDKTRCRKATVEFSKRWQFGSRKGSKLPAEGEFNNFCKNVCEIKFGGGHPKCSVVEKKYEW